MALDLESKLDDRFKSAGERRIAEVLNKYGIDFKYEPPIAIYDQQDKLRVWYPDFFLASDSFWTIGGIFAIIPILKGKEWTI